MIGADAFEVGREIRKTLVRPKKFAPINPKTFIPISRKNGRINFLSTDNKGNISYGEDCDPKIKILHGWPVLACVETGIIKKKATDFIKDSIKK